MFPRTTNRHGQKPLVCSFRRNCQHQPTLNLCLFLGCRPTPYRQTRRENPSLCLGVWVADKSQEKESGISTNSFILSARMSQVKRFWAGGCPYRPNFSFFPLKTNSRQQDPIFSFVLLRIHHPVSIEAWSADWRSRRLHRTTADCLR